MPESVVSAALLRRVLSDTERSVLAMVAAKENHAAIDLRLKLAPGTSAEMLPRIRAKVEQAARRYREEPSQRVRLGDERECSCGETFTVRNLSQRQCPACRLLTVERPVEEAALEAAGVSSEEEDTIHVGAGDGGLPVQEPPPSSPAPATVFDGEPEEPPVADEPAPDPAAANGNGAGGMRAIVAAAGARRERIVEMLRERERSVKCLSVEMGEPLEKIRGDLSRLEEEERAERAGRYAYDWPGAPPEGARSGKASAVWRLWTGCGALPESNGAGRHRPAPEPARGPEPEPEPARCEECGMPEPGHADECSIVAHDPMPAVEQPAGVEGEWELPADVAGRREEYLKLLFTLAAGYPEASHLFDRIERILDGAAAGGAAA